MVQLVNSRGAVMYDVRSKDRIIVTGLTGVFSIVEWSQMRVKYSAYVVVQYRHLTAKLTFSDKQRFKLVQNKTKQKSKNQIYKKSE